MLRIACGFLLLLACNADCTADGTTCKYWGYKPAVTGDTVFNCGTYANDTCGPTLWYGVELGKGSAACGNVGDQSPINLATANATLVSGSSITNLKLGSPNNSIISTLNTCATSATFWVNSHTMGVDIPTACQSGFVANFSRTGDGVAPEVFNLQTYHFHTPSEHTMDGRYFEMEAQMHHKNSSGAVLVVAVFLKADNLLANKCAITANVNHPHCKRANFVNALLLGGMTEVALKAAVAGLGGPPAIYKHTSATTPVDPYKGFVPPLVSHFFTYAGSLTAPPCTAGVTWVLHPTAVLIYSTTVTLYKAIIASYPNNQLTTTGTNNRPVQGMGLRKLYFYGQAGHTFLTTAIAAGVTTLPTVGSAGFAVGDTIIIDQNTVRAETCTVKAIGSLILTAATTKAHPAGATVTALKTTTPGVTVTPAAGAATTTPAATVTPVAPIRRYSEQKVTAKEEQGLASKAALLGVGCLIGMAVLMGVQGLRNRMQAVSTAPTATVDMDSTDLEGSDAKLLDCVE